MFLGKDITWFYGVVEDRFDPLNNGRYRVRVMGYHTDQKAKSEELGIPTNELLWMRAATSTDSASISGIGNSPTGLVEGTHVFGFFSDPFLQVGTIICTLPGIYLTKPDPNKGFSDPTGQYPRYIGNDVNILAGGGQKGESREGSAPPTENGKPIDVYVRDETTSTAPSPDETPADLVPTDDNPEFTIEKMLINDEGIRTRVYWDTEGYPTIGIGHLIIRERTRDMGRINAILSDHVGRKVTDGSLTAEEVSKLFAEDIEKTRASMMRFENIRRVYVKVNRSRQMALENMSFQMGAGGLAKFVNTLNLMYEEKWAEAQQGMLNSLWARQTPGRANRVSKVVRFGNLSSYGVKPPSNEPETFDFAFGEGIASNPVTYSDDPSAPPVDVDNGVLFEEPESSFAAQYPYNHVYESESGHIQEFDDTPGHERYHRKHPTGTFEEIRPDGTRVVKIVGDDFLIVQSGRNVQVQGNLNVVIEGNATLYNMGNVVQQIDGNLTQFVRGSVTQTIEGDNTQLIKGNNTSTIEGDHTATIKGNSSTSIEGNSTSSVKGNSDITVEGNVSLSVSGNVNETVSGDRSIDISGNYSINVGGNTSINSSNTVLGSSGTTEISGSTINLN